MAQNKVNTISENIDLDEKEAVDLDQAFTVAGLGKYNIKYSLIVALFLIGAIIEPVGYSYILPASKCDLEMSDAVRGFVGSVPYIGIVLTSFPWGYLVDTRGRKMTLIYSSLAAGIFGVASAFMPNLVSFIIFKFLTSLCIACPAAAPYTYIGEICPIKYRDLMLTVVNALQVSSSVLVPLFAWAILPFEFKIDFGMYYFRPWRLLAIVNASVFLIAALLLLRGPESPKYLISQGRLEESLRVLRTIYARNKRKSEDDFPIKRLKSTEGFRKMNVSFLQSLKLQSMPLFRPPHVKWMILNSTLMFGIFSSINGLYMWLPDILNRVFSGLSEGTACEVIRQGVNQTIIDEECNDSIDTLTYLINTLGNSGSALIAIIVTIMIRFIGKKVLLVIIYCVIGTFCILINFIAQRILFAILLSSIALMGLAIGPVNAFSVQLFPTHLRGMAVGLSMMVGRLGSVVGANAAGALLNAECEATFYLFGGLLIHFYQMRLCSYSMYSCYPAIFSRYQKKISTVGSEATTPLSNFVGYCRSSYRSRSQNKLLNG